MKVIVCVDDKMGVAFNHRRQSQDKELVNYILKMVGDSSIAISSCSRLLFPEQPNVIIDDDLLDHTSKFEYCFVEKDDLLDYKDTIEELILCKWNRLYPSDVKLADEVLKLFSERTLLDEIQGSSHDKITIERYKK